MPNRELSTVVSSYDAIVQALSTAPDRWWDVNPDEYQLNSNANTDEVVVDLETYEPPPSSDDDGDDVYVE